MNIGFDDVAFMGPLSKNRGIGNYAFGLFKTLINSDTENTYHMLNIMEEFSWDSSAEKSNIVSDFYYLGKNHILAHAPYKEILGEIIMQFIQKYKIDVFIITSPFDGHILPYEKAWFNNTKVVAIVYDIIPYVFKDRYLSDKNSYRWYMSCVEMLRWNERLLVISQSVKRDLVRYLKFNEDKIDVIWGAVDDKFKKISIPPTDEYALRKKFSIQGNFIMCTGGDDDRKNIYGLIQSFGLLPESIRNEYQLVVVCKLSPESINKYSLLAQEIGIKDQVVLTNFVSNDELVQLYNLATLMVFPSQYEGFGLPIVEAFACGTPVVTSNNSSLVEIAGEGAILVDPFSTKDVANGILKALRDSNLEDLVEKGNNQLKKFQWENVAHWTLESLDHLIFNTEFAEFHPSKVAFFTPLPPIESGISDYSVDILGEISKYFDIDVFIDDNYKCSCQLPKNINVYNHKMFKAGAKYSKIIYQIGNSSYHTYMLPYLEKYKGIIVLHDYNLHGALHYASMNNKNYNLYRDFLLEDYSSETVETYLTKYRSGNILPQIYEMQLNGAVVNQSDAVIVHSEWAAQNLLYKDIHRRVYTIPHYAQIMESPLNNEARAMLNIPTEHIVIAMFGYIHETKRAIPAIRAFAQVHRRFPKTRLRFVGKMAEELKTDYECLINELNIESSVCVTGYVDLDEFNLNIDVADICLNLRYPYNGETSGSLMRILAKGKAVVINDIGSFSEIPDNTCIKLPNVENMTDQQEIIEIEDAMQRLLESPDFRHQIECNAKAYAKENLDLHVIGKKYKDVIEVRYKSSLLTESLLKDLAQTELISNSYSDQEIKQISETLAILI